MHMISKQHCLARIIAANAKETLYAAEGLRNLRIRVRGNVWQSLQVPLQRLSALKVNMQSASQSEAQYLNWWVCVAGVRGFRLPIAAALTLASF